jgi:hypothetical protein
MRAPTSGRPHERLGAGARRRGGRVDDEERTDEERTDDETAWAESII